MGTHDANQRGQRMFEEKTVQYVYDGEVIAEDEIDLAEWIRENCTDVFEDWLDRELPEVEFNVCSMYPSAALAVDERKYQMELDYWIEEIVLMDDAEIENLGLQIVEVIPPEEREYTVEPYTEPWAVRGEIVKTYYPEAEAMEIGDVYDQGTYRVIRTKNAKGGRFFR